MALISLAIWSGRVDYALLYGGLDPAESSKVISALEESKVSYKTGAGGGIYVPKDKVYSVRMNLAAKGVPRGPGVGFEIFDKPNFGLSDFVQRANYLRAVQGELARTISELDVVDSSRVMVVMPENRLLLDEKRRPSASVFINVKGLTELSSETVNSIRFLVANAVEGLQLKDVAVVDNRGNMLSGNDGEDDISGLSDNQLSMRKKIEQYLSGKAQDMLETALGPGNAIVKVSAEINFDTINSVEEEYDPEGQVERSTTVEDETTETSKGVSGGIAGLGGMNQSAQNTNSTQTSTQDITTTTKTTETTEYEVGRTTKTILQAAGGIERLSAAVLISAKTEVADGAENVVPRSQQELDKLKRLVQTSLGMQVGQNSIGTDQIELVEMPFDDKWNTQIVQNMEQHETFRYIMDIAKQLVYPALAAAVIFLFFRTLKKTDTDSIPIGVPLDQFSRGNGNGNGNGNSHGLELPEWAEQAKKGYVSVDVLNQLVRENPSNMTQAIRSWLSKGKM